MIRDYVKGIDGLRAICALCILLGHIPAKFCADWIVTPIPLPVCCAYVFFVISGFLAGNRMDSMVSPRDYLLKKAKRILPLYYSYILVSILVFIILHRGKEILNPRIYYYLFLLPSIPFSESNGIAPLVHLWFIGTLLLFYLVFPVFAKLCRNKGESKAIIYAIIVSIAWFCIKMGCRFFIGKDSLSYRLVSVTCFDVLFLGVIGGLVGKIHSPGFSKLANIVTIVAWILFLSSGLYGRFIPAPIRIEYVAIISLLIILGQQEASFIGCLDNKVFRRLSSISYEIYVTQILVIILLSAAYMSLNLHFCDLSVYLISVFCVVVCSQIWKSFLRIFSH